MRSLRRKIIDPCGNCSCSPWTRWRECGTGPCPAPIRRPGTGRHRQPLRPRPAEAASTSSPEARNENGSTLDSDDPGMNSARTEPVRHGFSRVRNRSKIRPPPRRMYSLLPERAFHSEGAALRQHLLDRKMYRPTSGIAIEQHGVRRDRTARRVTRPNSTEGDSAIPRSALHSAGHDQQAAASSRLP